MPPASSKLAPRVSSIYWIRIPITACSSPKATPRSRSHAESFEFVGGCSASNFRMLRIASRTGILYHLENFPGNAFPPKLTRTSMYTPEHLLSKSYRSLTNLVPACVSFDMHVNHPVCKHELELPPTPEYLCHDRHNSYVTRQCLCPN